MNDFITLNTKLMNNKILFLFLSCLLFSGCMDKQENDQVGNPDTFLLGEPQLLGVSTFHAHTVCMKAPKMIHPSDSGMTVVVSNALDVPMRYGEGWRLQKQTGDVWIDKGYRKDIDGFDKVLSPGQRYLFKFPVGGDGGLEAGKYRVVKAFQIRNGKILQLGAEFEVYDECAPSLVLPFWMLYPQDKIVLGFYDIVLSVDLPKPYPMYLVNKTDFYIEFGRGYWIERYENDRWTVVKGIGDFKSDAVVMKPYRRSEWEGLRVYIPLLDKGLYRICREINYDDRTHLVTCEFHIY